MTKQALIFLRPTPRQRALIVAGLRRLGTRVVLGGPAYELIDPARVGTWPETRAEATDIIRAIRARLQEDR